MFGRIANERESDILESLLQNSKKKLILNIFLTKISWRRQISIGVGIFLNILRLRFF